MSLSELPAPARRIYCNRTLNLRSIAVVGFDMDYTLIHYRTEAWERHAFTHAKRILLERGWPVRAFELDPSFAQLGLILDLELGNIVKANRFGFVKKALHGTSPLSFETYREIYARELVELSEGRWRFLNTLFALSEAHLYAQCIDLLDAGALPDAEGPMSYRDVYDVVRQAIDDVHMRGDLKREIMADPDRFVELDADLPLALQDLRHAGKKVALITNSEWFYTKAMMSYAFDRYLGGEGWRSLFDVVIVAARKPDFFNARNPIFEIVDDDGLLRPVVGKLREGGAYLGGHAWLLEELFGIAGPQLLYVGDHIFSDVNVSKRMHRWRTALVVRELEDDIQALEAFKAKQRELSERMERKERLEHEASNVRLRLQRKRRGYGPAVDESLDTLEARFQALRAELVTLDESISPLARAAGELVNARWGLVMRAGNDKSHLARQIEKSADIYMSRVSNLLSQTPFVYLRSPRGSLPHDSGPAGGAG
ncbi:MAG: HAD-IG family 5'-nucleotidase [Myxococcota bacterium]